MNATETPIYPEALDPTSIGEPSPPSEAPDDIDRIPLVYIAGPFSGKDGWEIAENVHAANRLAREVARMGASPVTPHAIGAQMAGTETYEFWCAATMKMLRRCDAVVFTSDWERSKGARAEHDDAVRRGLPIFYQALGTLEVWDRTGMVHMGMWIRERIRRAA